MSASPRTDTIRAAPACAARLITHSVVPLPRRLAALLIALIATVSLTGTALGSVSDVINDFSDNGIIDACHSKADYAAARKADVQSTYGDYPGALDTALATPRLVGTDATPCPAITKTSGGSSIGGVALIAIAIGLVIAALALVLGGRRRHNAHGDGSDGEGDGSAPTASPGPDSPA